MKRLLSRGNLFTPVFNSLRQFHLVANSTHARLHPPVLERRGDVNKLVQGLKANFPSDQLGLSPAVLAAHGKDESIHEPVAPDVVFFPRTTQDVKTAVLIAKDADCCIVPWGAGTSLEGHIAALQGGLSIDMGVYMNSVIQVNAEDMDCRVQAGITRHKLNDYLRHTGLYFPVDPGADCTIGGMASTRASGTAAVKYGTMKDNVLGLECVSAEGEIFRTGTRARKSSAGYDLTSLIVGSEGTLATITEVQLKLSGQPEAIQSAICGFQSVHDASTTIVSCLQYGIPVARAEMLDSTTIKAVNDYSKLSHKIEPTVFFEFHGTTAGVNEQVSFVKEIAEANGAKGFEFAKTEENRKKLWKARHDAYYAVCAIRPGCRGWTTDVCVPLASLGKCIDETIKDVHDSDIHGPVFGHLGDGNFHVVILVHPEDDHDYIDRVIQFNERLVKRAIQMEGTCTGEHGVGYAKSGWLEMEHGKESVRIMKSIKECLDPSNRMNPGKIFNIV